MNGETLNRTDIEQGGAERGFPRWRGKCPKDKGGAPAIVPEKMGISWKGIRAILVASIPRNL